MTTLARRNPRPPRGTSTCIAGWSATGGSHGAPRAAVLGAHAHHCRHVPAPVLSGTVLSGAQHDPRVPPHPQVFFARLLGRLATRLGKVNEAAAYSAQADQLLTSLIEMHWHEGAQGACMSAASHGDRRAPTAVARLPQPRHTHQPPRRCHVATAATTRPPRRRHAAATSPPRRRHVAATSPPRRRHAAATSPPRCFRHLSRRTKTPCPPPVQHSVTMACMPTPAASAPYTSSSVRLPMARRRLSMT